LLRLSNVCGRWLCTEHWCKDTVPAPLRPLHIPRALVLDWIRGSAFFCSKYLRIKFWLLQLKARGTLYVLKWGTTGCHQPNSAESLIVRVAVDSGSTDIVTFLPLYKRHSFWPVDECQLRRRLIEIRRQASEEAVLCKWVAVSTQVRGETGLLVMISISVTNSRCTLR